MGSSGVVGFTRVHHGDRWGHLVLLGSLASTLAVVGSFGLFACALWAVGFIWGRLVNSRAPWGSFGSFGVLRFTRSRPWGLSLYLVLLSSLERVVGFTGARPLGSCVHARSLGSLARALGNALGDVGFIRAHPGVHWSHLRPLISLLSAVGVVGFTRAHPRGLWDYPGSLGTLACALVVVGFIRGRWVNSRAPWGSFGSDGAVVFTRVRPACRWVHPW